MSLHEFLIAGYDPKPDEVQTLHGNTIFMYFFVLHKEQVI